MTRPLRRMILHFSQIGFTLGLTFMTKLSFRMLGIGAKRTLFALRRLFLDPPRLFWGNSRGRGG